MAELKLFTFGPPRLERDSQPIDLKLRKALALLIYLQVTGQPQSRDTLATLLWPESDQREARARLRRTLHRMRSELGDTILTGASDTLSLNPAAPLWIDRTTFLEHAARGLSAARGADPDALAHLRAAADLYTDEFLAGWTVVDSADFDDWQFLERERLRHMLTQVLTALLKQYTAQGDWAAALPHARRWVALDPLHEAAQRELIRVYALAGQQSAAVRQYHECARLLDAELGVAPDAETTALYDDIRFRRFPPAPDGASAHPRSAAAAQPTPDSAEPTPLHPASHSVPGGAPTPHGADDATPSHASVPMPPTPMVSRTVELQAVCMHVREGRARAVTVTGIGGVGKTRLALEAAHALRANFADGVYFVELAVLNDATLVADAIAQALGVKGRPGQPISTTLREHLRAKQLLLVLDNFEHVVSAAPLVSDLLAACPALHVLATSRTALNIRAEQQFRLEPLSSADAVQLFLERAHAAGAVLPVTTDHRGVYEAICERLDRLPLAIELIAVRARTLAPRDLLRLLDRPLQSLVHGPCDVPPRHQALRNAIQWSYDLLDAQAQQVVGCLGVFAGSFSVEAAQAVIGPAVDVLPVLEQLQHASLVQRQPVADTTRFALLTTIREFALEQLALQDGQLPNGPVAVDSARAFSGGGRVEQAALPARSLDRGLGQAQRRHAAYFLAVLEQGLRELPGASRTQWPESLRTELPNLRRALQTLIEERDAVHALRLVALLWQYWCDQGTLNEGRAWVDRALALVPAASDAALSAAHHEALLGAAFMAFVQDDYACAQQRYEQLLALAHASGQQRFTAKALDGLGVVAQCIGHLGNARDLLEQSIAASHAVGDARGEHWTLFSLAFVRAQQGQFAHARGMFQQAVAFSRSAADAAGLASALAYYAYAIAYQGETDAQPIAQEALARSMRDDLPWTHQIALHALGLSALQHADYAAARGLFERAVAQSQRLGDRLYIAIALSYLGLIDLHEGVAERAAERLLEALQLARAIQSPKAIALACEGLACLLSSSGDWERATQVFGAIEMMYRRRGALPGPLTYALHAPFVQAAHENLGQHAFALAWSTGQQLTLDAACALAAPPPTLHMDPWAEHGAVALDRHGQLLAEPA